MNLDQSFSILFWLRRAKQTSDGLVPIWIRITVDGKRAEVAAKRKILPEHWDVLTSRANASCPNAKILNDYLKDVDAEITKRYNILLTTKDYVTAEDVKHSLRGTKKAAPPPVIKKSFFENFTDFTAFHEARMKIGELSVGRFKRFGVLKGKCETFLAQLYERQDILLESVQLGFIAQFQHYMRTVQGIGHNTSMKYAKDLKQVMEFAVTMGHIGKNPFDSFKCTNKPVKRVCLDEAELTRIINLQFSIPRLQEVRDVFVFCCFTGYAFKDVQSLTPGNVTVGIDKNKWIIHDRHKTDNPENVPLLPMALQIVEQYSNYPYCVANDKLLPVNSNQRYNGYLKELADLAGISKKITTHVARHTFATTICLTNGVPIETVQKLLAHASIRTTQIYAQITPIKISVDMKELAQTLTQNAPQFVTPQLKQANA